MHSGARPARHSVCAVRALESTSAGRSTRALEAMIQPRCLIWLCLMVSASAWAAPMTFPGATTTLASPTGGAELIWIEPIGDTPHQLVLRFTDGQVRLVIPFERHCTVAWDPSGRMFAVSDVFASNESRVTIFSLTKSETLVPVPLHLPSRLELLLKDGDHSYVEVSDWTSTGLRLVAWGYGGKLEKEFRRKVVCTLTSESAATCAESHGL